MTLEAFLRLPDVKPNREFACGEVYQKEMPDSPHARLQFYIAMLLWQFLAHHPLGISGTEWRFIFGPPDEEWAPVPDVAYVSFDRAPHGDLRGARQLHVAPDLATEVQSPGQNTDRFARKLRFYLNHGVRLVWVVDPDAETIAVYTPDADEAQLLRPGDLLDGGDVLPGFRAPVADIFAQLHV